MQYPALSLKAPALESIQLPPRCHHISILVQRLGASGIPRDAARFEISDSALDVETNLGVDLPLDRPRRPRQREKTPNPRDTRLALHARLSALRARRILKTAST